MKKVLLIVLVCVLLMSTLLACGNDTTTTTTAQNGQTTTEAEGEKETVTFWLPGTVPASPDEETESYKNMMLMFDKIRDDLNIVLDFEMITFAAYDDRCNTALSANTGPDILMVNSVTLGAFVDKGFVMETTDLMENSSIQKDDFFPGLFKHVDFNGKVFGLPLDTGTRALIYNKDMLSENGFEFGKEVTWDEMYDAAVASTQDTDNDGITDVFGYGFLGGESWMNLYEGIGMFAIQNQAQFFNDDLTEAQFTSPEVIEAVEFVAKMNEAGVFPQDAATLTDGDFVSDMFVSGKIAMFTGGHWALDYVLEKEPDFEVGVALAKNKQIGSSTGGWCLNLAAKAEDEIAELAWSVVEYVFVPENLILFTNIMPATIEANALAMQDSRYDLYKEVLPFSTHPITINKDLPEIAKMLRDEMQSILLGEVSVEEGMQRLNDDVNTLISR